MISVLVMAIGVWSGSLLLFMFGAVLTCLGAWQLSIAYRSLAVVDRKAALLTCTALVLPAVPLATLVLVGIAAASKLLA